LLFSDLHLIALQNYVTLLGTGQSWKIIKMIELLILANQLKGTSCQPQEDELPLNKQAREDVSGLSSLNLSLGD
jgi:hypothetical protein